MSQENKRNSNLNKSDSDNTVILHLLPFSEAKKESMAVWNVFPGLRTVTDIGGGGGGGIINEPPV